MRVFISHSSHDKEAVEALAQALRERGLEPWFDGWEIGAGDDIVARINAGLEEAAAGIVVFSRHTRESRWVEAETSYLTYARIVEDKALIPVVVGDDAYVPPLLRPLARRGIEEVEAIADAVRSRRGAPPRAAVAPEDGRVEQVRIGLRRVPPEGLEVTVAIGGERYAGTSHAGLPAAVVRGRDKFLRGFRTGIRRDPVAAERTAAERAALESSVADLGRALGTLCLPGDSGPALAELVDGCPAGTTVEVSFEAEGSQLLGLPFEALRLPDDRLLATLDPVVTLRRPVGLAARPRQPLAGPLRVLVAVGAPDERPGGGPVLDQERELQNILDAVEEAQRRENVQVRILEVGHPEVIGAAIERDAYHALHVSCHGGPGTLELEDEDGGPVPTTPAELLAPIKSVGKPLPLVVLSACHGGVVAGQTASFAEALLAGGVPCVVAMQTSVSDHYATELARSFYEHLARREPPAASRALAAARREVERARLTAVQQGAPLDETQPEYATAALFVAGEEPPLADFSLDKVPLRERPVYDLAGPVPQLRIDDLIGRRRELRETLRVLRDPQRTHSGVVLTGIGGVGKSAVAGRAMQRLAESGYAVPAHLGRFDLQAVATAVAAELVDSDREEVRKLAALLASPQLDDRLRLQLLAKILAEEPVVLVLDDFEQNLTPGGAAFRDPDVAGYLDLLARSARRGRLLVTCRYPVPGMEAVLQRVSIGPLSLAESRKLLQRLPGLRGRAPAELARVLRVVGGHPRMLEFLDGLVRGGEGRLPRVTEKLQAALAAAGVDPAAPVVDLDERIQQAVLLGARDVLLTELLAIARGEGLDEVLLQAAVSNLPVSPAGLAHMLAGAPADPAPVERALARLEALSLVFRFPDGTAWVHRWTAEGLAGLDDVERRRERNNRAGRYRWWRVEHESHDLEHALEAVRNHLAGYDFDAATKVALACIGALRRFQQSAGIAALAGEILEALPAEHGNYAAIADEEARAHLALGFTSRALDRYGQLLTFQETLVAMEPDRTDHQRTLSVFYERMGDLYRALGQGEKAREAYLKDLEIAERLAASEPDRADYQRDLSVSYNKVGDLYRALGQGEKAREAYLKSLGIRERLAASEPDRADYQRDLSVSYSKVGDLSVSLGQGEKAREAYLSSLGIAERLAASEPDRADYQHDLSVSYERMGDLYVSLGQGEKAREAYLNSLGIRERLAASEPDRADYQRDLSVSYNKVGDLYESLGQGEKAREAYLSSLGIAERLAASEPDRADYQHDLMASYQRIGDFHSVSGQGREAEAAYLKLLAIAERLAASEPDRADYQRDLSVSYNKVGDLYVSLGQGEKAREAYLNSLGIRERLAASEPDRADYQRDLSVSYNKVGDLYVSLGQGEKAREAYLNSLGIAERLAASEPDRADYQVDLVVSLSRVGLMGGAQGRTLLERALGILENLKRENRLAPEHEPKIALLKEMLE